MPGITWQRLMENKNRELDRLNGVYRKLLDGAGVEYIEGRGKVVDAHTVEVNGQKYTVSHLSSSEIAQSYLLRAADSCGLCDPHFLPLDGSADARVAKDKSLPARGQLNCLRHCCVLLASYISCLPQAGGQRLNAAIHGHSHDHGLSCKCRQRTS